MAIAILGARTFAVQAATELRGGFMCCAIDMPRLTLVQEFLQFLGEHHSSLLMQWCFVLKI